ncbi:nuclear transport factor 2 family protein [Pedococcus ginsenosidimutans]|jgi:uncharacterized protein (TIGR02246 family)|uniref:Nuclear transport factor 2 family protein n=1 Tax=Pedococcus ginsenosidimutans TaxID=490570 RepID=A0ABP8Y309_9MICO
MSTDQEVLASADALVRAFASGDRTAYFACFAPDATFVFHTTPQRLGSRAAYEALWEQWVTEDGFAVVSCSSTDQVVQVLGPDAAVFAHGVTTVVEVGGIREELHERETIVFARRDGVWMAVHEHLSPTPLVQ